LLEPMLATGLSSTLTTALRELAASIPTLKKEISDGLLRMLSLVLMNAPLRHSSLPRHMSHSPPPLGPGAHPDPNDVASTVLALRTLGSFNFDGKNFIKFSTLLVIVNSRVAKVLRAWRQDVFPSHI
jgi:FKBP12-rapamycin complex-associated protein